MDAAVPMWEVAHLRRQLGRGRLHHPLLWLPQGDLEMPMLTGVYEFIEVRQVGLSPSGKTTIYDVVNRRSGHVLGTIKWWGVWRQYVFFPTDLTLYSKGCLEDIADFIGAVQKARLSAADVPVSADKAGER